MLQLENLEQFGCPSVCPSCGTPLKTTDIDVFCPNENCTTQIVLALSHFIKALGIKNVSSASLLNFGIRNFQNLLDFRPSKEYKSQTKFYEELENKMFHASEKTLLSAMNFKGLSEILLGKVFDFYGFETIKNLWKTPDFYENLMKIGLPEGIGAITLGKFCENLPKNMEILTKIISDGRYSLAENEVKNVQKNGKSICFTGALATIGRKEASKLAENAGFEVKSGVSKGLTYLVTNNPNSGSSKNDKARKFGTLVIDEKQFLELVKTEDQEVFSL